MLYLPFTIIITMITLVKAKRLNDKGIKIIYPQTKAALLNQNCMSTMYKGYRLLRFPKCSMMALGTVITDENRNILFGCEMENQPKSVFDYIMLHEMGHHEAVDGLSDRKFWWNIEDYLRIGVYSTFTVAELAADKWAFENGADPKAAIKFLGANMWLSPITTVIRIYHAWRYMINK